MFGAPQPATASTTQTQNNMWMTNGNGKYEYFILCNLINYVIIVSYNSTKTILNLLFSFTYYHCTFLFGDYCTMIMFFMLFHRSVFIFWFVGFAAVPPANNNFVTDNSFSSVFGNQDSKSGEYLIRPISLVYEIKIFNLSLVKLNALYLLSFTFTLYMYIFISFYGERFLASDFVSYVCILLNRLDSLTMPGQVNPKRRL